MIGSARNPFKPAPIQPITVRIPMAVKMIGIGRSKLYELINAGEITTIKVGCSRLVIVDSLKDFVERQRA